MTFTFHSYSNLYESPYKRLKYLFVHFRVPERICDSLYKIIKDKIKTNKQSNRTMEGGNLR